MNAPEPTEDTLQRGQIVLSRLPVAVAQCSGGLESLWVSQRYADWLGRSRTEIVGRPVAAALGAERLSAMRPHIDAALATDGSRGRARSQRGESVDVDGLRELL